MKILPQHVQAWIRLVMVNGHPELVGRPVCVTNASVRLWTQADPPKKDDKSSDNSEDEQQVDLEEKETQHRFFGSFWFERYSMSPRFRFTFEAFQILNSQPHGPARTGDIELPTLTALLDWEIEGLDMKDGPSVLRIVFPQTNNGITRMQIAISREGMFKFRRFQVALTSTLNSFLIVGDGAAEAHVLKSALEAANKERRSLLTNIVM